MSVPQSGVSRHSFIIADDDQVVRSMLSMALGEEFELLGVAGDSEEAVKLACSSQPEGALVDVDMPKGGGLAAVRGILEVSPNTAIVILSGDESDAGVRELMQAGATAYRRKGVAPRDLGECLSKAIALQRGARADGQASSSTS